MTASNGYRVIKAPCCGAEYSSLAYMSINYSAREYWSDGRSVESLAPQDGGLLRCICSGYFLRRHADSGSVIYNPLPLPPSDWETQEVWDAFLRPGETSRDYFLRTYDFRSDKEREIERLAKPKDEMIVGDHELADLLESGCSNTDVLIVARRRYWRYLNDSYRADYRSHVKKHPKTYPEFMPSDAQRENMSELVHILETLQKPDGVEICELHRELGNFQKAIETITEKYDVPRNQMPLALEIHALNLAEKSNPVLYQPET